MSTGPGRRGLLAIAFAMGLSAAIAQVLLIRELLSLCRGNELIIGMIFSSWFLGIYLGARVNSPADDTVLVRRVMASLALLPPVMALSVYGAQAVQLLLPRAAGTFYPFTTELLLALVFTAPVGFFVGFFFPPLVSLLSGALKERSGGAVFFAESMGSFCGGALFSFVLVELANPLAIACGLLCASLLILFYHTNRKLVPLALIPLALIFFSGQMEGRIFSAVWNRTHTGILSLHQRTKYQTVAVESAGETASVYGDGILLYTLPDRYEARGLFHLVNALRQDRGRLLLMGPGPGSLLHNLLAAGVHRLRYFEPDPGLWDAAAPFRKKFYPGEEAPALSVVRRDLRNFLSESREKFDLIISIPPAPENIMLNRFYTRDFFSLCKKRLAPRGVFITALHGFSNYMSADLEDFIATVYLSFREEFPVRLVATGETIYLVGAAGRGDIPGSGEALIRRYAREQPLPQAVRLEKEVVENYSADEMRAYFEKTQAAYFEKTMARALAEADENRDLKPGAYWRFILLAALREQSSLHALMRGLPVIPALALLLTVIALWDAGRRHGRRGLAGGFIMYCTGLISISTMLVLIVLYQNGHGVVYYRISLINALFMLGLALGSFSANRVKIFRLPAAFAGIMLALGLMAAEARRGSDVMFWGLLLFFSFLCGAVFPLLFTRLGTDRYLATASILDAMDHFGAIAGSILTVMIFLPFLGITGTMAVNAAVAIAALAAGALYVD